MNQSIRTLVSLLPLLVLSSGARAQVLEFDPAQTKIEFTLADVLHTVQGTFHLKHGSIRIDTATSAVSGEIVVDATSGQSGSNARDRRMHANILESDKYPEISFRPGKLDGAVPHEGKVTLQMHGIFRIHGADHEIAFPVDVEAANGQYTATLHFEVPYVQWGMKNPSTFILRVGDKVNITIRTVAHSAPGAEELAQ
jgi:polyisoprenoid-binding protein YceI